MDVQSRGNNPERRNIFHTYDAKHGLKQALATAHVSIRVCETAGNEFCERLAYYGVATNLPIYLTDVMKLSVGNASIQTSLFSGTCYMTPLIGAWLADGYWGRYKTIMAFSLIYAVVRVVHFSC